MLAPKQSVGSTTKAAVTRTALNTTPSTTQSVPKKPLSAATMSRLKRSNSSASSSAGQPAGATSLAASGGLKSTSRSSLLSDTTLSVCSLASSQATSSSRAQPRPGAIKKSSSSLSAGGARGGATTNLSFSGIKRPISSGSAKGIAKTASSIASSSSATSHSTSSSCSSGAATIGACSMTSQSRRVPTLAMSLRDKDQQIRLLIKERDEKKFQAELMARKVDEWREKFEASELERSHVTSEADDEVVELRRLAQEFEDENKTLAQKLAQREQTAGDLQFKLDELQCERDELHKELEFKEDQLKEFERERHELAEGQKSGPEIVTERAISKAKYEREIGDLKEKIVGRDEQIMQLRTSLEMRKNEVQNLQQHTADLERKLRIECERSERHLKRIDEVNLELKAAEAKLNTKAEENEVQEAQIKQLRHELRQTEEKLEQVSLARKKDVDMLHSKLSAARRGGSTTPSGSGRGSPATSTSGLALPPFKTPTPQDEIVRLQMEIRDLKDQLIDREAELDCNRRDLEVMRRKMETRTLEVDCNNQELARRCQDLLEQNRQSEDTIKQLLRSTTEHSASLMRATEDLKEANSKCLKLREEINELELKFDEQLKQNGQLTRENKQLSEDNELKDEQVDLLRQQVDALNEQIGELCCQLDVQTQNLHKDRETLADQLSEHEINAAQLKHDLAGARQDLRTQKLQQQEVASERDRLKSDLEMREKYIKSRNEVLETMRLELEDCKRSLADHKCKLESLRASSQSDLEGRQRELKDQIGLLKEELQLKLDECNVLKSQNVELQSKVDEVSAKRDLAVDEEFDLMRRKHSAEIDELHVRIQALEDELEEARTSTLKSNSKRASATPLSTTNGSQTTSGKDGDQLDGATKLTYESEIQFLNSLVVDMQRKCDTYKSQLVQMERSEVTSEFDKLLAHHARHSPASSTLSDQQREQPIRASTLKRANGTNQTALKSTLNGSSTLTRQRVVRIQDPLDELLAEASCAPMPPTRHISGRPYCDICQVYDTHHTIYCPKVNEKLAARYQSSPDSQNNNNGVFPNGYQTADDMFRECVAELEGAGGPKLAGAIAPFASLRRPTKQEQQGERMRLH